MARSRNPPSVSATDPTRILVVDDDESIRSALVRLLGQHGYDVGSAEDGLTALRAAQEHPPDVVLTDFMMPGMNGVELRLFVESREA